MKYIFTGIIILTLGWAVYMLDTRAWAQEKSQAREPVPTKELMDKFLSHMVNLAPFMVSEQKYLDSKNFTTIDSNLKDLSKLVKEAAHDPQLQGSGYKISQKVLENHIAETERVFRIGNKPYSRWMLNSTLSICMSCHTQIPTASRSMKNFEDFKSFTSSFDQAEFLFATRAFDKAKETYEKLILGFPEGGINSDQLETSIQRMITYYARIQRSPSDAYLALQRYQKNDKLPPFLKEDLKSWSSAFKEWEGEAPMDLNRMSDTQILDFAKKNLDPKKAGYVLTSDNPRAVHYLKVSGILYQYLQLHPNSSAAPDMLYWLAICDKGLSNNFFFSLGDIYLRECVIRYPSTAIAKDCYNEYEQETVLSYSGSSGTHMPDEVKRDLDRLKALIIAPPTQKRKM